MRKYFRKSLRCGGINSNVFGECLFDVIYCCISADLAKAEGYEICAVFVLTNDPGLNVERVRCHVRAGGHDVPVDKILSRYGKSLNNLSQLVRIADHTMVIDNSGDEPHMICEVRQQQVTIWENELWDRVSILRLLSEHKDGIE